MKKSKKQNVVFKYKLSRCEQETLINYNEEVKEATVFTTNKSLLRKLEKLALERPEECIKYIDGQTGCSFRIPKAWVKISPSRVLTEEQKRIVSERLKRGRKNQS